MSDFSIDRLARALMTGDASKASVELEALEQERLQREADDRVRTDHEADLVFKRQFEAAKMFEPVEHESGNRGAMKIPPELAEVLARHAKPWPDTLA